MANDPLLDAHFVARKCYEIGGAFSPASIRDQMLRAALFAERAVARGVVDDGAKSLLVVGGGPAGLTAAMAAADLGVATTLVERSAARFGRYAACTTRVLDPTLYDWPMTHWRVGAFPFDGRDATLPWKAGRASAIAAGWDAEFNVWLAAFQADPANAGRFRLRPATSFVAPATGRPAAVGPDGLVEVELRDASGTTSEKFGAVLSCVGWGEERTAVGGFRGYRFWERDKLLHGPPRARVILSGGGDGALQDLIRIATGRDAREAFDAIFGAEPFRSELAAVTPLVRDAEDVAARALSWSSGKTEDGVILARLEAKHQEAIDLLLAKLSRTLPIRIALCFAEPDFTRVSVAHRAEHLPRCYALNRFLALLLMRTVIGIHRLEDTEVVGVRAADGHACIHPDGCHGLPHVVAMQRADGGIVEEEYDVVVPRHGVDGARTLWSKFEPPRTRQLLPFFL